MRRKISLPSRLTAIAMVFTLLVPPVPVFAGSTLVAPGSGGTQVYTALNGIPIVNIDAANSAGLSINKFTSYNVNANGLVLNNTNSSQLTWQSQLAGQVAANPNLQSLASAILLEVVSPNRSLLEGFTEVLGGKANVVVANPFGITCSGCGFINTDRASLVTGTPGLKADGSLGAFSVNGGDILITGSGLNATAQQLLDLVSRSVKIDGQVNALDLALTAGTNSWDYASRAVTGSVAANGAAPSYAIDSTVLGGMFAQRITLLATETGVGVRMLGDAAATAQDFTLTAAGKITLANTVQSAADISITSTAPGGAALTLVNADLAAQGNLALNAAAGGATLSGGALSARGNLIAAVGTLFDTASAAAVTDNNLRYAGGALTLSASGAAAIDGVSYSSAGALNGSFGSLISGVNSGATFAAGTTLKLTATTGELALGSSSFHAANDLMLASNAGGITLTSGVVQTSGGNLSLSAAQGVANGGIITADAGNLLVSANGTISGAGTMHAGSSLVIADLSGGGSENIALTGGILLGGAVQINAAQVTMENSAGVGSSGDLNLHATGLTLDSSAQIVAASGSTAANPGTGTLNVTGAISNAGMIRSDGGLALSATSIGNAGTVSAANNLALSASGGGVDNEGMIATDATGTGTITILSNGALTGSGTMNAAGLLQIGDLSGGGSENITLSGGLLIGGEVQISASQMNLSNHAGVGSQGNLTLQAVGLALDSSSQVVGASGSLPGSATLSVGTLNNAGVVRSNGNLAVTATFVQGTPGALPAASITNTGTLSAANNLTLSAAGGVQNDGIIATDASGTGAITALVNGTLFGGGTMNAAGPLLIADLSGRGSENISLSEGVLLGNSVAITASQVNLGNGAGILTPGTLTLQGARLSLDSGTQIAASTGSSSPSSPTSTITLSGALIDNGLIRSDKGLTVTSSTIATSAPAGAATPGGAISAYGDLLLYAGAGIANGGSINSDTGDIAVRVNGTLSGGGTINAAGLLDLGDLAGNGSENLALSGGVLMGGSVMINASQVTLGNHAGIGSSGNLTIQASGLSLDSTSQVAAAMAPTPSNPGSPTITVSGGIADQGVIGSGANLTISASTITTAAPTAAAGGSTPGGAISAHGTLLLNATAGIANNGTLSTDTGGITVRTNGTLSGGGSTTAASLLDIGDLAGGSSEDVTLSGGLLLGNSVVIGASQVTLANGAGIGSSGNLTLHAAGLTLESTAQIVAATGSTPAAIGTATLSVAGAIVNAGTIRSDGSLALLASFVPQGPPGPLPAASITNTGTVSAANNLTLSAAGGIQNDGVIATDSTGSGGITLMVNGTLSGGGSLNAAGPLQIGDQNGGTSENISLSGGLLLGNSVAIGASQVTLANGAGIGSSADLNLQASGLTLDAGSQIIACTASTPSGYGAATLSVSGALVNAGMIRSDGNLAIESSFIPQDTPGSLPAASITNTGTLSAANNLTLSAAGGIQNDGVVATDASGSGNVTLMVHGTLSGAGSTDAAGLLTVGDQTGGATENITLAGGVLLGGTVQIGASQVTLTNAAAIGSLGDMSLQAAGLTLDSSSQIVAAQSTAGTATIATTGAIDNAGAIRSDGSLTLASSLIPGPSGALPAASVTNTGTLSAASNLTLSAAGGIQNNGVISSDTGNVNVLVNGTLSGTGVISASGNLGISDLSRGSSETIDLGGGGGVYGNNVNLAASSITLESGSTVESWNLMNIAAGYLSLKSGALLAETYDGPETIAITNDLTNHGTISSDGNLTVSANTITNYSEGLIYGAGSTMTLNAPSIVDNGTIYTDAGNIMVRTGSLSVIGSAAGNAVIDASTYYPGFGGGGAGYQGFKRQFHRERRPLLRDPDRTDDNAQSK